jgi:hypothetical protein
VARMTAHHCPECGGVVERTSGEATRTMAPAFARSLDDLYTVQVTVTVLACTSCEWCAEFTGSDTLRGRGGD